MTGNYTILIVDQDRVGPAKCLDTVGNLANLRLGMRARVVFVGFERAS